MQVFIDAKEHFGLHLRPQEVLAAMRHSDLVHSDDPVGVEDELTSLCEWGNLTAHPDTTEVNTVEEFNRRRFLYQLTAEGEAAERAIATYYETIHEPGALQTAALGDIRELLAELEQIAIADELDDGKAHRTLEALRGRFEELTSRAQAFMGGLQRTIDLHGKDVEDFLKYKETLIEYLERFIHELIVSTLEIRTVIDRLEGVGVDEMLKAVAQRDVRDMLTPTAEDDEKVLAEWRSRWTGLRSWFVSETGTSSQAEILRASARSAIPDLLAIVASINDRRVTRSDRRTDWMTLAQWFAQADSDGDAHRLWRAAFALAPSRHLQIDSTTLETWDVAGITAQASWLDAPPLRISPRLRQTGWYPRSRSVNSVIDRSKEKRLLATLAVDEAAQIAEARRRLANDRSMYLSDIGDLDETEFALFLDLLGEALSRKIQPTDPVTATSTDGSLEIELSPVNDNSTAVLNTAFGRFSGPNHRVLIRSQFGDKEPSLDNQLVTQTAGD